MDGFAISHLPDKKKKVLHNNRSDASCYFKSSIHYGLFDTAERLSEQAFTEKEVTCEYPFHNNVPVAVCAYLNSLEAYLNFIISSRLEFTENIYSSDIFSSSIGVIDMGIDTKLDNFYDLFGLEKSQFIYHEDVKILASLRNEISHFFPYVLKFGDCPKRLAAAMNKAKVKKADNVFWTTYLSDVRILNWGRRSFIAYIDELANSGFDHLDTIKQIEKLNAQND